MALKEAIKERDAARQADSIIQSSVIARQQKIENTAALVAIQTSYPDGIPALLVNKALFINVGNRLETMTALNTKLSSWKASLISLKNEVNDLTFEADIQAEIDLI